jgi:K+-sensing histidine kinase KdpD
MPLMTRNATDRQSDPFRIALGRMIEMFLNVERLSDGEIELKHDNFSMRAIMGNCVDRASPLAERKQIRVTMDQLADEVITGDRELMEYAFYNLLTNAIKYSPPNTEVRVSGGRDGDWYEVSIEDQGIGMTGKEVRKIFRSSIEPVRQSKGEAGTDQGVHGRADRATTQSKQTGYQRAGHRFLFYT